MPYRNYDDPSVLFVDQNTDRTSQTDSTKPDYNPFYYSLFQQTSASDRSRVVLCGFSFFDEVNGLDPQATEGIDLDPSYGALASVPGQPHKYHIGFTQYLDALKGKGINYLRIWLLSLDRAPFFPFQKSGAQYDLSKLDNVVDSRHPKPYFQRLEQFIKLARDRGMIICLSFFSVQMIRKYVNRMDASDINHWWKINPFNKAQNVNGLLPGGQEDEADQALKLFCKIQEPGGADPTQVRLYALQKDLVTEVVKWTKPYWNVVYELFNEPGITGDDFVVDNIVDWHIKAVGWIKAALGPDTRRLISITAQDVLLPQLLDALNVRSNDSAGDIDIAGLHGNQWGGDSKANINQACAALAPSDGDIINGSPGHPGILTVIGANKNRRLALVFDCDAHYLAQKYPAVYLAQTLKARGSFNYRWAGTFLRKVDSHCTPVSDECGLNDRLGQIFPANQDAGLHQRITTFPAPPAWTPTLLQPNPVAAAGQYFYLDIGVPPAGQSAQGYIAYFGWPDPSQQNAVVFSKHALVERVGGRYRALRPAEHPGDLVQVAVAARNGLVPGPLSPAVAVLNSGSLNAEIVSYDLRAMDNKAIDTRRDFGGSVTFRNTGQGAWLGKIDNGDGSVTTLGVYMQVMLARGGQDLVFVPMTRENLEPNQPEIVQPNQAVKINLNLMLVQTAFAQSAGQLTRILMPYSRGPLSYNLGMATVIKLPNSTNYGHFGTVYTKLDGKPLSFSINMPKRLARQLPIVTGAISANQSLAVPLSNTPDFKHHLFSITGKAKPGTIIHPQRRLEYITATPQAPSSGSPGTILRIANPSSESAQLTISAVELHPADLYYVGSYATPLNRGDDAAPGIPKTFSLSRFDSRFHSTAAWSDTIVPAGAGIDWATEFLGNPPGQNLEIKNGTPIAARVNTATVEIWEDVPLSSPPQEPPRQIFARTTFPPGASPAPGYVSLVNMHNCDGTEKYFVAYLKYISGAGNVRCAFVLRANGASDLEPWIEITATAVTSPLTVELHVLEECVDTTPFP